MMIPVLSKLQVTNKDGSMHPDLHAYLSLLTTALLTNLSDEGYNIPQQPTTNINVLNNAKSIGKLIYDNTTHQLKININGTFKVITVT